MLHGGSERVAFCHQRFSKQSLAGQPEKALLEMREAMRLSPFHPSWYSAVLGLAFYLVGDHAEAVVTLCNVMEQTGKTIYAQQPRQWFRYRGFRCWAALFLIASCGASGRAAEAKDLVEYFQTYNPNLKSRESLRNIMPFKDEAPLDRLVADLAKAGLPD